MRGVYLNVKAKKVQTLLLLHVHVSIGAFGPQRYLIVNYTTYEISLYLSTCVSKI